MNSDAELLSPRRQPPQQLVLSSVTKGCKPSETLYKPQSTNNMNLFNNPTENCPEDKNRLDDSAVVKKRQLEEDEDQHSQIESTADSTDRKRFKRSNTLDSYSAPQTNPEMDPTRYRTKDDSVDDLAGDMEKMELDGEPSEEETRQCLRDWAAQWSSGEIGQGANNPPSSQDNVNRLDSQPSSSPVRGGGLQPQDLQPHVASQPLRGDPEKKPANRHRHRRQGAQHHIVFNAQQVARPVLRGNGIPPVPPIPFRYRAEWTVQQSMREEMTDEPCTPRAQTSRGQSQFAIRREPQENEDEDNEATMEEARRQNGRRRRGYDTVVEEDLGNRSRDKGRSRPSDVARAQAPAGPSQLVRPETRLPRSPGMLHLSHEMPAGIPESPFISPPRSRFQIPIARGNMSSRDEDVFSEPSFASHAFQRRARNYRPELASPSEAEEMEAEPEEGQKGKLKKE